MTTRNAGRACDALHRCRHATMFGRPARRMAVGVGCRPSWLHRCDADAVGVDDTAGCWLIAVWQIAAADADGLGVDVVASGRRVRSAG